MNRRQFINRSAVLLAAGSMANQSMFAEAMAKFNKSRIGMQLYTVKDELPKDFVGTLKKFSVMGYSEIEAYGFEGEKFFDYTMKDLRNLVTDMGMSISGSHINVGILPEDIHAKEWDFWKKCATAITSADAKWAIQAWIPEAKTMDDLKRTVTYFNHAGEVCKAGGVKFGFHNHYDEFRKIEGEIILDYLVKNTDPKLVSFQMDMGHTVNGGGDPVRYLRDYPGRFRLWHASDFDTASRKYVETGKGSVPYSELFKIAESSGLEHILVEQETEGDIFDLCKKDFDFLKQFKWTKV